MVGALLPEGAVVVDESNTSGIGLPAATAGAPRHDWLTLTGGAIGYGLPAATGAAVACPERPVWCLQADGSAMYTISALWSHAREGLDVTTVVYNNSAYAILRAELQQVGAAGLRRRRRGARPLAAGPRPAPASTSSRWRAAWACPPPRWTPRRAWPTRSGGPSAEDGPHLIEAVVPPVVR